MLEPSSSVSLAVDLGNSGGRIHLGRLVDGRLRIEQIYRFANAPVRVQDNWYWDPLRIWSELQTGLTEAAGRLDNQPLTIGIDSIGVDYALLGPDGALFAPMRCMRDPRTRGLHAEVYRTIPPADLYRRTGIMEMPINTLVQLLADRRDQPWLLESAGTLLFMADLMAYFLTGRAVSEMTLASTSQFFDPAQRGWRRDVVEALGLPVRLLPRLVEPATVIGPVLPELVGRLALPAQTRAVAVASHDTAAAFAAAPLEEGVRAAVVSLGTWALFGVERAEPNLSPASWQANFSNECGVAGRVTYLKILMGLWLLQECLRAWQARDPHLGFAALHEAATRVPALGFVFDPDDPAFLAPDDMPEQIAAWFRARGVPAPTEMGQVVRAVYDSLALSLRRALEILERLEGARIERIHVVGGGAQASLLCQSIADATGRPVIVGPTEAAALGNILSQCVATGAVADFAAGRRLIARSFPPAVYHPQDQSAWLAAALRFPTPALN